LNERQQEEKTKVQPKEIFETIQQWPPYRGQTINEDRIRTWLSQFETIEEQRYMFTVLQNLKFYSEGFARKKMKEAHEIVKRGLIQRMDETKRSDILVSYADSLGKSGAHFARLYADEVPIYAANVVEKGQLSSILATKQGIQAIVFIDDFVGTGNTAITNFRTLHAELSQLLVTNRIKMVFVALVAFIDGWKQLEGVVEKLSPKIEIHACEVLEEADKCFSENSRIFKSSDERIKARETAIKYGARLEKKWPLGYGGLQLAVVFEYGCPNNSLPILWKSPTKEKWLPLFKRS
jgi:hypothetical protein